jgi:hypothetical protein
MVGRGAIVLMLAGLDLDFWILGALLVLWGLVASLKVTTERAALRIIRRSKESWPQAEQRRFAGMIGRG